ncbi:MAG: excinuclease ABC subunit UvrA [Parcubacteria group bacterium]|nr:excinuclease ABC subunit UvrA [Parcubacteria group bacterium]
MSNVITIRGAREHNLKNINLTLPRDKFIVFTGLSGSGKSSLAFDTLYAEGQRRYVESLSAYARQFLGLMEKPDVDQIDGLSPAISIDQKSTSRNPRSTVGTVTEIYDYLRLLYARIGEVHCPNCGRPINRQSLSQITDQVLALAKGTKFLILAPLVKGRKGEYKRELKEIADAGFARVRIDGEMLTLEEARQGRELDKQKKHTIEVVVDRLEARGDSEDRTRIADSLETALDLGNGIVSLYLLDTKEERLFSEHFACIHCGINLPEIEPRSFSFNSPYGACPACDGLGTKLTVDPDLVIPNKRLTLAEGAIRPWNKTGSSSSWYLRMLAATGERYGFSIHTPVAKLPKEALHVVLYGTNGEHVVIKEQSAEGKFRSYEYETEFEGVIPNIERRYRETESDYIRSEFEEYMRVEPCAVCKGARLKQEVLSIFIGGKSIVEVSESKLTDTAAFFHALTKEKRLSTNALLIAHQILKEINARLTFLIDVGVGYLTLDRASATLSGGEAQRIRLATQIGSSLMGVLYILDEPSIGLHQHDNSKLITTLKRLRDLGNTVIVVEHDEEIIRSADHIVDIGPGAGEKGGEIVGQGTVEEITKVPGSLTGQYLAGRAAIAAPKEYRKGNGKTLAIRGAREHNLKAIDVAIPLGKFVAVTGVSGSGKSTLVNDILAKALARFYYHAKDTPGVHKSIGGTEYLDKVVVIDQSPIGRTPRSNPATYTGLFTPIRELFAATPEARIRGYKPGRFSFNVKGGRCETCAGDGVRRIEMQFLPDVYITCEECKGKRYNPEALSIHYRERSIADVLGMSVDEALAFFVNVPQIRSKLKTLADVGLGYIKLGQPATTLSGGEAQRVKLSTELSRRATGRTLYILDEPTTGLHFHDVKHLLSVLHRLADAGNTILVIEHNLDVIKSADWIIDLGPEGGDAGGEVVAQGTPKEVAKVKRSYTGQYLAKLFARLSKRV